MKHPSDLLTRVKEYPVSNFSHFFFLYSFFLFFFLFDFFYFFSFVWRLTSTISIYLSYRQPSTQRELMNLTHMPISESVKDTHRIGFTPINSNSNRKTSRVMNFYTTSSTKNSCHHHISVKNINMTRRSINMSIQSYEFTLQAY